ncbi:MAG TPA: two-component regulator propeller domain-containing protein, partial [bacterium]
MKTTLNLHHSLGFWICLVFLVFSPQFLRAIRPYNLEKSNPLPESYRWQTFPELTGRNILCIVEDPDKSIWFGTADEGVLRHDGLRCINMGLSDSPVRQLLVSREKALLAATDLGIFRYAEGEWKRLFPEKGHFRWTVYCLLEASDGSLWAGTAWGAICLRNGKAAYFMSRDVAQSLKEVIDPAACTIVPDVCTLESRWTRGLGVDWLIDSYAGDQALARMVHEKGPAYQAGLRIGDCVSMENKSFLFPSGKADEAVQNGDTLLVRRVGLSDPMKMRIPDSGAVSEGTYKTFPVTQLYQNRAGSVWFGLGEGLEGMVVTLRTNQAGSPVVWKPYTARDCPTLGGGRSGRRMVQDDSGQIWMVSEAGISLFNGTAWEAVSSVGTPSGFSVLKTRDGTVWVGGLSLLALRDKKAWTLYRGPDLPIADSPLSLYESSDGAVWVIGVGGEVVRLDYGTYRWDMVEGLAYQCETPDHMQWFLSQDHRVVRYDGKRWFSFGVENRLMLQVQKLFISRRGDFWAAGMDPSGAALALFDGNRWWMAPESRLKGADAVQSVFELQDGSFWVGFRSASPNRSMRAGGAARFIPKYGSKIPGTWVCTAASDAPFSITSIGQSKGGALWFGGERLYRMNGSSWHLVENPPIAADAILDMYTSPDSILYIATRTNGLLVYNGSSWKQFTRQDGLADNKITAILQTRSGSMWAGTEKGISRFDGSAWIPFGLPQSLRIFRRSSDSWETLREAPDSTLWIIQERRSIRFHPSGNPPETVILSDVERVPRQGNVFIQWMGIDLWHTTPSQEMQFSFRLDGQAWSPFAFESQQEFLGLKSGRHIMEVRARNMDFNIDSTPANLAFTVEPPVYKQWWFITLISVLMGSVFFEAGAILKRNRTLNRTNRELREQTRQLKQARDDIAEKAETLERYNKELQTFAYVASHDLQEPLRLISNYVSLIAMRYQDKLDRDANEFIGFAIEGARRAQQLINDLLFYFRISIQETTPQVVSMGAVLKRVLHNLKLAIDENQAAVTSDSLPEVTGDEKQLEAVLQNLIVNAIKYRKKESAPRIHISVLDENDFWHFTCQDNGIGMSKEYHERIFVLFQRLHSREAYSGTGIGLAVCKKILE